MQYYHRLAVQEDTYSQGASSFACSVRQHNYLACLDLAGPGTFTGVSTSPAIYWDTKATDVLYGNLSRTTTNRFGVGCEVDQLGIQKRGDGVVNSMDIAVLVYAMFGDAPYGDAPESVEEFRPIETVEQRLETQSRCNDGSDRATWQVTLNDQYCHAHPSPPPPARRQLRALAPPAEAPQGASVRFEFEVRPESAVWYTAALAASKLATASFADWTEPDVAQNVRRNLKSLVADVDADVSVAPMQEQLEEGRPWFVATITTPNASTADSIARDLRHGGESSGLFSQMGVSDVGPITVDARRGGAQLGSWSEAMRDALDGAPPSSPGGLGEAVRDEEAFVRTFPFSDNAAGSWYQFVFAPGLVPVVVELLLHGVWVPEHARAQLSNAPAPTEGDDIPFDPSLHQVRWHRTEAHAAQHRHDADRATVCQSIVSGGTGTHAVVGDTLSVRQEGGGIPCPFWIFLWVPTGSPGRGGVGGRRLFEAGIADERCGGLRVCAVRGSVAMTTAGGVVLRHDSAQDSPHVSLPPPPPLTPALPPPAAPPAAPPVKRIEATQHFDVTTDETSALVKENLDAQLDDAKAAIQNFVATHMNISDAEYTLVLRVDLPTNDTANARRLAEIGDDAPAEDCSGGVTLHVFMEFNAVVDAALVDLVLKSNWTDLVEYATENVTTCGSADFETFPLVPADADAPVPWVAIVLGGGGGSAFICVCCYGLLYFVTRKKKRKEEPPDSPASSSRTSASGYSKLSIAPSPNGAPVNLRVAYDVMRAPLLP